MATVTVPPALPTYENIAIESTKTPISVERCEKIAGDVWTILIMGSTGAGKSSFIEALGRKGSLSISSNHLDGCTQSIAAYQLKNVKHKSLSHYPIHLVDSPGFSDVKISEMEIVKMLKKWITQNNKTYFDRIFYVTPITQIRFPGSQRQVLRTFQELTGVEAARNVTFVTTMWDTLWGEAGIKRADRTYSQLETDILKPFILEGALLTKFHNTQESALSVLDRTLRSTRGKYFHVESLVADDIDLSKATFGARLYEELSTRIQSLRSQRDLITSELAEQSTQGDALLKSTLIQQVDEVNKNLARFEQELADYGPPPFPSAQESPPSAPAITALALPSTSRQPVDILVPPAAPPTIAQSDHVLDSLPESELKERSKGARIILTLLCCGNTTPRHLGSP